ncbi:MAG TPA: hypothetical protein VMR97_05290 [Acidimicrobiales bacterium]|nr:hypothetical protein [Acidimicrobiales bacterium]
MTTAPLTGAPSCAGPSATATLGDPPPEAEVPGAPEDEVDEREGRDDAPVEEEVAEVDVDADADPRLPGAAEPAHGFSTKSANPSPTSRTTASVTVFLARRARRVA